MFVTRVEEDCINAHRLLRVAIVIGVNINIVTVSCCLRAPYSDDCNATLSSMHRNWLARYKVRVYLGNRQTHIMAGT